jgi:NADH dehydrogenase [ubiquinone] 1 alpha subcomplex assembly factor 5
MTDDVTVFNRALVRARRQRRAAAFDGFDFLAREVAERLADRLDDVTRRFPLALDLGCRGGVLGSLLAGRGGVETLVQTDLAAAMAARARAFGLVCAADEEALPFADGSLDLALSSLALHWVNDLPGTLVQIRRALKPDGLLLAALFGGETLTELRAALAEAELETTGGVSPRVSPFADVRDMGALLQRAGYALPVVDSETITVSYAEPLSLMRDLRGMAESNAVAARRTVPMRRDTLMRACERYAETHAGADGRIPATFQVLFLTGWAPDASQPKALQPGQAATPLAQALGAAEGRFDEKAVPVASKPPRG